MPLRSSRYRENFNSPRPSGQQESHLRISPRNHSASIPNSTLGAFTEDVPTDPAGFFSDDPNMSYGDILRRGTYQQVLDKDPTIEKMSIAVDFGTENSAVVYKLHWKGQNLRPRPGRDQILLDIEKVQFSGRPYVKTQIGWHSETLQMLYGYEVDDAIRRGKLLRGSHVRGLKLTLLDPSGQTRAERSRLEKQIKELPREIRFVQDLSMSRCRLRQLTPEDLVSKYIGYLVRHCLHQIFSTADMADLQSPKRDLQTAFGDLDPAIVAKVVLYIAVPSLATPEFVDLIVAAAQRAGFSDAVVAPEPACAQQLLLQRDFETKQGRDGNRYSGASIILDIGGGTADLQTLSIVKYNPTEIKEEMLGDGKLVSPHIIGVHKC
jgi:molecular chaperone DnaK (HSP70)